MSICPIDIQANLSYNVVMICEFPFCIYNKDNKCTIDEVRINAYGVCDCALYPTIDKMYLDYCKKKELKLYERYCTKESPE